MAEFAVPRPAPAAINILLVEDDDDDTLIVRDLLGESGQEFNLERARTLAEGLDKLEQTRVDCVLLDLRLPDATGLEAITQLRLNAAPAAIVVLTGMDEASAGEAAVNAGAQDFLVKGKVDSELLARAVRYAVGRRHTEEVDQQLRLAEVYAGEAARLERGLVPHPLMSGSSLWIADSYLPGRQGALLGGDFYDAVESSNGGLRAIIGDVSGRGPDEAALGAGLRIAWRALTLAGTPGDSVLPALQQIIEHERQSPNAFATLCTLEIDASGRTLSLRRAGHPAPILVAAGAAQSLPLDRGGPPIGMFDGAEWPELRLDLPPEWAILLFTDGVIEGRDGGQGRLGETGLERLISEHLRTEPAWREEPDGLLGVLLERVRELHGEELRDDIAMLLLGSAPAPPSS
jgi:serine phosphatase RsbU (regulator of sigma subunit)